MRAVSRGASSLAISVTLVALSRARCLERRDLGEALCLEAVVVSARASSPSSIPSIGRLARVPAVVGVFSAVGEYDGVAGSAVLHDRIMIVSRAGRDGGDLRLKQ